MITALKLLAAALAAAGLTLTTAAAAEPTAGKQRVAIQSKGTNPFSFVLTPLTPGKLARDSGSTSWSEPATRVVIRDGQRIQVATVVGTFVGERGSLEARFHIEWTKAGNEFTAGTGTWRIVGGSGAYDGLRGGGRHAHVWLPGGKITLRAEGLLLGS